MIIKKKKFQEFLRISKSFLEFPRVSKSFQEFLRVSKNFQEFPRVSWFPLEEAEIKAQEATLKKWEVTLLTHYVPAQGKTVLNAQLSGDVHRAAQPDPVGTQSWSRPWVRLWSARANGSSNAAKQIQHVRVIRASCEESWKGGDEAATD